MSTDRHRKKEWNRFLEEIRNLRLKSSFYGPKQDYWPSGAAGKVLNEVKMHKLLQLDATAQELTKRDCEALCNYSWKEAKVLFLILSQVGRLNTKHRLRAMQLFKDNNFGDKDLPVPGLWPENDQNSHMFKTWGRFWREKDQEIDEFCKVQYRFTPPVFSSAAEDCFNIDLPEAAILPITDVSKEGVKPSGAFSVVFKVKIHKSHVKLGEQDQQEQRQLPEHYALKQITMKNSQDSRSAYDVWHHEATLLLRIKEMNHPHAVWFLTAFRHDQEHYLLFEWADQGSLRDFLDQENPPKASRGLFQDFVKQFTGLANLLWVAHSDGEDTNHVRHGDIKPDNILCCRNGHYSELGMLKLADWGISRQHNMATSYRVDTSTLVSTRRYQPPEAETKTARSRLYDVWSMGCTILECAIWLLYGQEKFVEFHNRLEGSQEKFYFGDQVHQVVTNSIRQIQEMDERCKPDTAMGDLLQLVKNRLLVIALPDLQNTAATWDGTFVDGEQRAVPYGGVDMGELPSLTLSSVSETAVQEVPTMGFIPTRATAKEMFEQLSKIRNNKDKYGYWRWESNRANFTGPSFKSAAAGSRYLDPGLGPLEKDIDASRGHQF